MTQDTKKPDQKGLKPYSKPAVVSKPAGTFLTFKGVPLLSSDLMLLDKSGSMPNSIAAANAGRTQITREEYEQMFGGKPPITIIVDELSRLPADLAAVFTKLMDSPVEDKFTIAAREITAELNRLPPAVKDAIVDKEVAAMVDEEFAARAENQASNPVLSDANAREDLRISTELKQLFKAIPVGPKDDVSKIIIVVSDGDKKKS